MKLSYDPETDIVLCEVSKKKIDHAEEQGPFILHFDRHDQPVLVEIQNGSRFIGELARLALTAKRGKSSPVEI